MIRVPSRAAVLPVHRRRRVTLFWLFAAALTLLVLAAPSMATKQQLKSAKRAFETAYVETIDTSGRLEGELDQIVTICDRGRFTNNRKAQQAIWKVVESEAKQSQRRWQKWSDGLATRLPPLAAAIEAAQGGLTPASKVDLIQAHSALLEAIKLHRHQAADAEVAGTKLEAHLCGAAKLATHSLAASEDKGLDLYHQARALIGEALQRG